MPAVTTCVTGATYPEHRVTACVACLRALGRDHMRRKRAKGFVGIVPPRYDHVAEYARAAIVPAAARVWAA